MKKIISILALALLALTINCSLFKQDHSTNRLFIKSFSKYAQAQSLGYEFGYELYSVEVPIQIIYVGQYYGYTKLIIYTRINSNTMGISPTWDKLWEEERKIPIHPLRKYANIKNYFCSRIYDSRWDFNRRFEFENYAFNTIYYYVEIKVTATILNEEEKTITKIEKFRIMGIE